MPLFEHYCPACDPDCQHAEEHFFHRTNSPDPNCDACGQQKRRLVSTFAVVFTGLISTSKYGDPRVEGYNTKVDGHWAWRRRSSVSGKPESVWIDDFQKQKEFCQQEGLTNPRDVGPQIAGSDGGFVSPRGLPGCW